MIFDRFYLILYGFHMILYGFYIIIIIIIFINIITIIFFGAPYSGPTINHSVSLHAKVVFGAARPAVRSQASTDAPRMHPHCKQRACSSGDLVRWVIPQHSGSQDSNHPRSPSPSPLKPYWRILRRHQDVSSRVPCIFSCWSDLSHYRAHSPVGCLSPLSQSIILVAVVKMGHVAHPFRDHPRFRP